MWKLKSSITSWADVKNRGAFIWRVTQKFWHQMTGGIHDTFLDQWRFTISVGAKLQQGVIFSLFVYEHFSSVCQEYKSHQGSHLSAMSQSLLPLMRHKLEQPGHKEFSKIFLSFLSIWGSFYSIWCISIHFWCNSYSISGPFSLISNSIHIESNSWENLKPLKFQLKFNCQYKDKQLWFMVCL